MTEDTSLTRIRALGEVIQQNLALAQRALGIETTNDDDLDELVIESEIVAEKTVSNCSKTRLTVLELMEEKRHVCAMQAVNRARFLESQAIFAGSVAKFNSSKDNFVRRPKKKPILFF